MTMDTDSNRPEPGTHICVGDEEWIDITDVPALVVENKRLQEALEPLARVGRYYRGSSLMTGAPLDEKIARPILKDLLDVMPTVGETLTALALLEEKP